MAVKLLQLLQLAVTPRPWGEREMRSCHSVTKGPDENIELSLKEHRTGQGQKY